MLTHFRKKGPEKKLNFCCITTILDQIPSDNLQRLEWKKVKMVPHKPYSPDLALCDFWLLPEVKDLKGQKFEMNLETVKAKRKEAKCKTVSKDGLNFMFEWIKCWKRYVELKEDILNRNM